MTPNPVHLDKIKTTILSLLIATAGGLTAWLIDLPIPFLLGSTIAVTAASLSGVRIYIPDRLRGFVFFSLGIQAGSGVSPGILDQMVLWPVSFLMLFVALVLVTSLTYLMLRKGCGWDGPTALFSALPGALSFVLVAAGHLGQHGENNRHPVRAPVAAHRVPGAASRYHRKECPTCRRCCRL
ncbi:AbrB family transcriptional regulator [Phyllobacterium sp. CL33Tsu]|uniref:AbrB family transcriptional regulator n=1 Tax=Phyllobacterium sp. CL33Tsu TaxID=1798191 RepID=UPI000B82176F|nr:AbrB family transcriptional regulator [Phyllobacterium sp. CL33Tsu]